MAKQYKFKQNKETLQSLIDSISGKAPKATTLEGYGIQDAYTQTEVDNKIEEVNQNIIDNEKVAASALYDLNSKIGDINSVLETL